MKNIEGVIRQMRGKLQAVGIAAAVSLGLAGCSLPFSEYSIPQTDIETTAAIPERVEPVLKEQPAGRERSGRLTAAEDLSVYVEPGEYKGLILETPVPDDGQVEEEIQKRLEKDSSSMRTDAQVQEGDTVLINYVGTVNHSTFEGSIANNYMLRVGSGEMADGFEAALIGMKIGQTRTFSITYPQDDIWSGLAGVTAEYRVTLQSFTRPAQLTEEWAKEQGAESVEAYRKSVRRGLADEMALSDEPVRAQAWKKLMDSFKILDYPLQDIENAKKAYETLVNKYAEEAGMTREDFLASQELTQEAFEEQKTAYARQKTAQNLVLQAVMDAEGMSLSDEASEQVLERLAKAAGKDSPQELEEAYGESFLNESIALERVLDYVVEHKGQPEQ